MRTFRLPRTAVRGRQTCCAEQRKLRHAYQPPHLTGPALVNSTSFALDARPQLSSLKRADALERSLGSPFPARHSGDAGARGAVLGHRMRIETHARAVEELRAPAILLCGSAVGAEQTAAVRRDEEERPQPRVMPHPTRACLHHTAQVKSRPAVAQAARTQVSRILSVCPRGRNPPRTDRSR